MGCYDPPPEWEGDARKSAEEAAKILCQLYQRYVADGHERSLPPELQLWFLGHRRVDLRMLLDRREHPNGPDRPAIDAAVADIRRIEAMYSNGDRIRYELPK